MLEYSLDGHNVSFSAIRTVRVLRPLRAINRVPSEYCFRSLCFHQYIFLDSLLVSLFYNTAIDLKQMIWTRLKKDVPVVFIDLHMHRVDKTPMMY